jgi:hypothetical protein
MRKFSWVMIGAVLMLAAGCQSHQAKPVVQSAETPPPPAPTPVTVGQGSGAAAVNDPSASRMQDLCGALLYYYASNRRFPAKLEELRPYADLGVTLGFTSPVTGEPYVYVPAGMRGSGIRDTLVLYDPHADAKGDRWGIVVVPPEAGKAVLMYAIPLDAKLLKAYGG